MRARCSSLRRSPSWGVVSYAALKSSEATSTSCTPPSWRLSIARAICDVSATMAVVQSLWGRNPCWQSGNAPIARTCALSCSARMRSTNRETAGSKAIGRYTSGSSLLPRRFQMGTTSALFHSGGHAPSRITEFTTSATKCATGVAAPFSRKPAASARHSAARPLGPHPCQPTMWASPCGRSSRLHRPVLGGKQSGGLAHILPLDGARAVAVGPGVGGE